MTLPPFIDTDEFYSQLKQHLPEITEKELLSYIILNNVSCDRFFRVLLIKKSVTDDFVISILPRLTDSVISHHVEITEKILDHLVESSRTLALREILSNPENAKGSVSPEQRQLLIDLVDMGII